MQALNKIGKGSKGAVQVSELTLVERKLTEKSERTVLKMLQESTNTALSRKKSHLDLLSGIIFLTTAVA